MPRLFSALFPPLFLMALGRLVACAAIAGGVGLWLGGERWAFGVVIVVILVGFAYHAWKLARREYRDGVLHIFAVCVVEKRPSVEPC